MPGLPTSYARDPGSRFASASAGPLPNAGAGGAGASGAGGAQLSTRVSFWQRRQLAVLRVAQERHKRAHRPALCLVERVLAYVSSIARSNSVLLRHALPVQKGIAMLQDTGERCQIK